MKRREALSKIVLGGTTVFLLPVSLSSCEKNDPDQDNNNNNNTNGDLTIDLSQSAYSDLNDDGGYVITNNIIIINSGGTFIALSSVCTHSGCTVGYSSASDNIICDCHNSVFSTSGSVLQGPAGSPLKKYNVSREGDILTIT